MVKTNKKSLLVTMLVVLFASMLLVGGLSFGNSKPQVSAATSTTLKQDWRSSLSYNITNLTITTDYTKESESYYDQIADVSEAQNGSLKAYVFANGTDADSNPLYDCVIYGAVDKIYAPEFSEDLFSYMDTLETIVLENFDTSNVTDMSGMFGGNFNLKSVTFPSDMSSAKIQDAESMFISCSSLKRVEFPDTFELKDNSNFKYMFSGCSSLEVVDMSSITMGLADILGGFEGCTSLKIVYAPSFSNEYYQDGLPITMYEEGTANEFTTISSATNGKTLVYQANKTAAEILATLDSENSGSEVPSTGFDMNDIVITSTLGLTLLVAVAVVFVDTKKKSLKR